LDKFQQYVSRSSPVYDLKLWKNSIRDETFKVTSADELLRILNFVKFLSLKNKMRKKNAENNIINEKYNVEWGFFVDKEKVEESLSGRFLLRSMN
jgi:hypothetical protein